MTEAIEVVPPREVIETRMFESSRWEQVKLRPDDIIIATWAKSGTTLTQQIVFQLLSRGADRMFSADVSPWVDLRWRMSVAEMAPALEAQTRRRFLKTHLPFGAAPFSPQVKYVYIGRDARDMIWSAHNHAASFTDEAWARVNAAEGPWPKWGPPNPDVREWYLHWLETDEALGFHDLSLWENVQSWWDQRRRPNVLLLHYANLIADMAGEMRRLADFLDVEIDEARLPQMVEHCSIDYMRDAASQGPAGKERAASFFYKGTNGRWKDVLSLEEIAACDALAAKRLTADCAHWLKTGCLPE